MKTELVKLAQGCARQAVPAVAEVLTAEASCTLLIQPSSSSVLLSPSAGHFNELPCKIGVARMKQIKAGLSRRREERVQ